jgi:hypothetical protein
VVLPSTSIRGLLTASQIDARGLNVYDTLGNVILSSGSALQNQVSSSANLLQNSDLTLSGGSWAISWLQNGVADASIARNLAGDTWRPIGGNTIGVTRSGTPTGVWDMQNTSKIPVIAGQRYEVSGLLACHRCNAQLTIGWYTAAGTYITENGGPACTTAYGGGQSLTGYFQGAFFITAPTGAVYATFWVRSSATGESNPYTWLTQGMVCQAAPSQTTPSQWSPSNFAEQITSANASTYIADLAVDTLQIAGWAVLENILSATPGSQFGPTVTNSSFSRYQMAYYAKIGDATVIAPATTVGINSSFAIQIGGIFNEAFLTGGYTVSYATTPEILLTREVSIGGVVTQTAAIFASLNYQTAKGFSSCSNVSIQQSNYQMTVRFRAYVAFFSNNHPPPSSTFGIQGRVWNFFMLITTVKNSVSTATTTIPLNYSEPAVAIWN